MIKCGTDIIEVNRIKEALDKKGFKERNIYRKRN